MLVNPREILSAARRGRYAIPGFDCVEDVMVRTMLETAEECRSPVFMMCLVPDLEQGGGAGWAYLPGLIKAAAAFHRIPAVLHLDHADSLDAIGKAVDCGFTSVMIDGSSLPFDDNVRLVRAAVAIAHPRGVAVEAELGHVGGMDLENTGCRDNILTEPDEVARFVALTEVDSLAVSIGTSHGMYLAAPALNIERLIELDAASPVPLVLHGGSGTPDEQVRQAIRHGITKLNIYADIRIAMRRGLDRAAATQHRDDPPPGEVFGPMRDEIAAVVRQKIALTGSSGQA